MVGDDIDDDMKRKNTIPVMLYLYYCKQERMKSNMLADYIHKNESVQ